MSPFSPPLSLEPFQRLQVNDGLLITAARWQQAHSYHRARQNIHYQALNQGGIVWGLGVCLMAPPSDVADAYRDQRWLQIQPGLAIDGEGNPIVVPEPMAFRIASVPPEQEAQLIYLCLRYVDPEGLQGQKGRDFVTETFRVEETTTPPHNSQIELCRILLQPGEVQLQPTLDVFAPGTNQLDLRDRPTVQTRASVEIKVAFLNQDLAPNTINQIGTRLSALLRACPNLYPPMQGIVLGSVNWQPELLHSLGADLLCLTYAQCLSLTLAAQEILRAYLGTGAVMFVEISAEEAGIAEFSRVKEQLGAAIATLSPKPEFAELRQELETESRAMDTLIHQHVSDLCRPLEKMAEELGMPLEPGVPFTHPLWLQPFVFSQLPLIEGCPIHLKTWGGIVFAIGSISKAWGIDDQVPMSRETIRSAQELGINLLSFAQYRHHLTQLQQPSPPRE
ncbi:MAG: hypothetical protein HC851_09095 [Acaryochloris sp. RU_4_1]|nr:hypothetical protein [Acaryochloris sp. RU_4_1]NJR54595.1 hypothetical protein [Acaryochloris sp. CRU_2_0]